MRSNFSLSIMAKLVTLILIMNIHGFAYAAPKERLVFVGYILNIKDSQCVEVVREKTSIPKKDIVVDMRLQVKDMVKIICATGSVTVQEGGNRPLTITTLANNPHEMTGESFSDAQVGILKSAWDAFKQAGYNVVATVIAADKSVVDKKTLCGDKGDGKVRWEGENSQQTITAGQRSLYIGLNRQCYPQPPSEVKLCLMLETSPKCQSIPPPKFEGWEKDNQLLGDVVIPDHKFEVNQSYTVNMIWNKTTIVVKFKIINGGDNQLSSSKADGNSLSIFDALKGPWQQDSTKALEAYQKVAGQSQYVAKVAKTVISMRKPPKDKP